MIAFRDQMGLTFPVLYDEGGVVHALYRQQTAFPDTIYPQDWIVGSDGRVAYVNNGYDPDAIESILLDELSP